MHDRLTTKQILDAFQEEAIEIIPKLIDDLEERLKPIKDEILEISKSDYEEWIKDFQIRTLIMFSGKEKDINRLQELKKLIRMIKARNTPHQEGRINDAMIGIARAIPVEQMYSFEKVKRHGNKFQASCPFHTDNTPSFFVYNTGNFICYSCGSKGSSIDFYMKLHNKSFKEAVLELSK